mgnify:CR=1 FL=1
MPSSQKFRTKFRYNARILYRAVAFSFPYRWDIFATSSSLFLNTLVMFLLPWLLGRAFDMISEESDAANFATGGNIIGILLVIAGGVLITGLLRGGFMFGVTYYSQILSQKAAYDIRNKMYDSMQRQSFYFYDHVKTAEVMSRATADVESLRMFLSFGLPRPIQTLAFFLGVMVILLVINWQLGLIVCIGMPAIAYRAISTSARLRPVWQSIQQELARTTIVLQENLSAAKLIRSFGRQDYEQEKFERNLDDLYRENMHANEVQAFNTPLMTLILYLIVGATLLYGGYAIINDKLTGGELTQSIFYMLMLTEQVRMLGWMGNLFARVVASGERIFEILDGVPVVTDKEGATELSRGKGVVQFQDVSFSYGDGTRMVLENINLEAQPGQVTAVVGLTGSGKTSLINLMPRFYDVTAGRVLIDGTDVRDVTLESLRRQIGIVQQDVFLFSASLRDNIAYGYTHASMEEVVAAAKAAQLHEFIVGLEEGYETWIGERGVTLSGGQRQRLAIARTLIMNPQILILDDSLSSVDTETEHLIQQALKSLMTGRTSFVIAQRLAGLVDADQIVVLDKGVIAERGTHTSLLSAGGLYKDIYDLQALRESDAMGGEQLTGSEEVLGDKR